MKILEVFIWYKSLCEKFQFDPCEVGKVNGKFQGSNFIPIRSKQEVDCIIHSTVQPINREYKVFNEYRGTERDFNTPHRNKIILRVSNTFYEFQKKQQEKIFRPLKRDSVTLKVLIWSKRLKVMTRSPKKKRCS